MKMVVNKTQLKTWQNDIVKFVEDVVWIPTPQGVQKLRLWDWQKDILKEATALKDSGRNKYKVICISLPKRNGKSLLGALILSWKLCCFYNTQGVVCSNSYSQAQSVIFDVLKDIIRCSPILLHLVKVENILEDKVLLPDTKSRVVCLSAKIQTSFGFPVTIGVVDEIHASDNPEGQFQVLASQCADRDGQIILPSQASSKTNVLYRLYQIAQEDKSIYFHYSQKNLSPLITDSFLKSRQKQMLPSQFKAYHRNEWTEGGESLFTQEQIEKCLDKNFALSNLNGFVVGSGLDRSLAFSRHADKTVLTLLAKGLMNDKEIFFVADSKVIKFSDAESIKSILLEARQQFSLENICFDVYQSQDLYHWCLNQGFKAELLHLTREVQMPMFNLLYRIIDEGRLKFSPDFTLLKKELEVFSVDTSMNPPKFGGQPHDDAVYSLALALWSLREIEAYRTNFDEVAKLNADNKTRITTEFYGPQGRGWNRQDDFGREFLTLSPPDEGGGWDLI